MPTTIVGLDHVQITAPERCEPQARAFYGELLGLRELPKPATLAHGGVWFALGEQELHIGVEQPFRPARKGHPAFRVRSVDELRLVARQLEGAGHDVRWDERVPDVRRFYVDDPWGNRLELQTAA